MYQDEIDTKLENQINDEIAEKAKEETNLEKKSEIEERVRRKYSGGFMYLDFAEKLKALNGYVPDFLINNSEVYSIVSAGIHSLEEEKCKEYYDTLKNAVDIIIHEEEANRRREELKRRTRKEISQAVKEIKEEL